MTVKDHLNLSLVSPLPPPAGGISSWTVLMLKALQRRPDVTVSHVDTSQRWRGTTEPNLPFRLVTGSLQAARDIIRVWRMMHTQHPDVLHLCTSASFSVVKDLVMVLLARQMGVPVVVHYRTGRLAGLADSQNWEWKFIRAVVEMASCVVLLDERSTHKIREEIPGARVELIPNPIDPKAVEPALSREMRAGRDGETVRIVYVGYVIAEKGIRELVQACLLLDTTSVELELVGPVERDFHDELRALAETRDNGNWLRLYGKVGQEQALQHIQQADLFAFPSYSEGCPNAVLEAMMLGKPIVAAHVGAIPEMLGAQTDDVCGLLVRPYQIEELTQGLAALINNRQKADELGKRARRRALTHYSIDTVMDRYIDVWKSLVQKR